MSAKIVRYGYVQTIHIIAPGAAAKLSRDSLGAVFQKEGLDVSWSVGFS